MCLRCGYGTAPGDIGRASSSLRRSIDERPPPLPCCGSSGDHTTTRRHQISTMECLFDATTYAINAQLRSLGSMESAKLPVYSDTKSAGCQLASAKSTTQNHHNTPPASRSNKNASVMCCATAIASINVGYAAICPHLPVWKGRKADKTNIDGTCLPSLTQLTATHRCNAPTQ